ncbi:MAG: translation elongation factor Ts [Rhizomicrobium sp.]|jgi:elongation factor Ts
MANITSAMVKELRDKTGAGMMDCKAALEATSADLEAAVDWLRKKGLAKAAKKAGRLAAEGLIGVAVKGDAGAVIEINSETDFVARNDQFKEFVKRAAELALELEGDVEKLVAHPVHGGGVTVQEHLTQLVAKIGENMSIRRASALAVSPGVVASYIHNAVAPDLGKMGVIVALRSTADPAKLGALGKQIAMHIAAAAPLALTPEQLPADVVERERNIQRDVARQSGKPDNVIEKMMEGRMRKFYEESVLLSQIFVIDQESSIAKVLEKAGKDFGASVEITGFYRFAVGEGIDKGEGDDFASEVKKMAGG